MFKAKQKGQSTLEYIAIFVAIVAAIVALVYSALSPAVSNVLSGAANKIGSAGTKFSGANIE